MLRRTALALALMLILLGLVGDAQGISAGRPIKVGLSVPYGGNSPEGRDTVFGAQLAFEEQNHSGGVGGRELQHVIGDNQCDPAVGVNAVRHLINVDTVDAVIGSVCSSVSLAVMPILQGAKVPNLDVSSTNPKIGQLMGAGGNIWYFRLNLDDGMMASVFAHQIILKEVKSLAIFAVQTDYGRGAVEVFKRNLQGVKIVAEEYYPMGQNDFRALLTKAKSENPKGFLIVGDYPEASQVVIQAHEVGWEGYKLYGRGSVVTPEMMKLLPNPSWLEGAKEANFWAPSPAASYLAARYKKRFNEDLTRDGGMGYFGGRTLVEAMKSIKGEINRKSIRDALEKVNFDLPGLGHVKFDSYHQAHYPMFILTVKNGKISILKTVPTD
jgi:branched-chain amino acid transport system substrate-binding protein